VDLRDGNQALAIPMNVEEKVAYFQMLCDIGFKEIEVGFPSASETEYKFLRRLVDDNLIPDDVAVQVLVQAREELIRRTFESLKGVKKAIVHVYNSTNPAQREQVFNMDQAGIKAIAVNAVKLIRELVPTLPETEVTLQYSPESFSLTELEFSLEICRAVMEKWGPTPEKPMILNLPATVEVFTPNIHADQIEWFCRNLPNRESAVISLHTHNDRGTGVAATELALLAGADRVEGTLFGNGERTGNLDIVTVALNMFSEGVDPGLDLHDINHIRGVYERCTRMTVPERLPYAGDLVFTAFSGSHQDAINKGFKWRQLHGGGETGVWKVPYLLIDPEDIGRNYNAIIRINSQSGKGGVAYILEKDYGIELPKTMRPEVGAVINKRADELERELSPEEVHQVFREDFIEKTEPYELVSFRSETIDDTEEGIMALAEVRHNGEVKKIRGTGNGPIQAFVRAIRDTFGEDFDFLDYHEHALGTGARARAIAYVQIKPTGERSIYGAGIDASIDVASIKATLSALNRNEARNKA
jgi:2-isopropylmalate synthase